MVKRLWKDAIVSNRSSLRKELWFCRALELPNGRRLQPAIRRTSQSGRLEHATALGWLAPVQARQPEGVRGDTNFVAEGGEHFASHFELTCLALCPLLSGFSQTMVSIRDVGGGGFREAGIGERCLESTLRFGELCQHDLFGGNSAKLADEANPA